MHTRYQQKIKQQHKKQTGKWSIRVCWYTRILFCPCMHMPIHRYTHHEWLAVLPSIFRWFLPFLPWCLLKREDLPSNLLTLLMSYMAIFIRYLNSFHTSLLSRWRYRGKLKPSQWQFFPLENPKPLKLFKITYKPISFRHCENFMSQSDDNNYRKLRSPGRSGANPTDLIPSF